MHMDQIAKDVGVDLHTESLLLRAEQLAKLEYDKNIDKVIMYTREYISNGGAISVSLSLSRGVQTFHTTPILRSHVSSPGTGLIINYR